MLATPLRSVSYPRGLRPPPSSQVDASYSITDGMEGTRGHDYVYEMMNVRCEMSVRTRRPTYVEVCPSFANSKTVRRPPSVPADILPCMPAPTPLRPSERKRG